jgi:hypothetical protein
VIRSKLIALFTVAACTASVPSTPAPVDLKNDASGLVNLPAGHYRVTWTADCERFFLGAPTSGAPPVEIPSPALPSGSAIVTLPGGPAYVNRGGSCAGDYEVRIESAP